MAVEVHERLFIRGRISEKHFGPLQRGGFTVVSLISSEPFGIRDALGASYEHLPCFDRPLDLKNQGLLDNAVDAVVLRWLDGQKLLVHCWGGNNRAGYVVTLAYRIITRCSGEDAVNHLQSLRPNALHNESFAAYLRGLPSLPRG